MLVVVDNVAPVGSKFIFLSSFRVLHVIYTSLSKSTPVCILSVFCLRFFLAQFFSSDWKKPTFGSLPPAEHSIDRASVSSPFTSAHWSLRFA